MVDTRTHVCLAAVVNRGPYPDDREFRAVVRQAHQRRPLRVLLGDAGYDAEKNHRFLERRNVLGVIPPRKGRPPRAGRRHQAGGFHRRFWHEHWPKVRWLYGKRWAVETHFSMVKRLLDSAVRARRPWQIDAEAHLKEITLNLMIAAAK